MNNKVAVISITYILGINADLGLASSSDSGWNTSVGTSGGPLPLHCFPEVHPMTKLTLDEIE